MNFLQALGIISALVGTASGIVTVLGFILPPPSSTAQKQIMKNRFLLMSGILAALLIGAGLLALIPQRGDQNQTPSSSAPTQAMSTTSLTPTQSLLATSPTVPISDTPTPVISDTPTPGSNTTTSDIPEIWKGPFNQPGYAQMHVKLDVMSMNDGSFTGIWMGGFYGSTTYDIGQVSVAGQTALFSSIPGQAQTDLQNSYGSGIPMGVNARVVQWHGQGDASGTIWPSGYYYAIRSGNQLEGVAYESQGSELCTFSLQGTGSLGN